MKRVLFACDGAPIPKQVADLQWDAKHSVNYQTSDRNLNLHLDNLSHKLLGQITATTSDLVRIATYVYASDQMVSRGGLTDVYGHSWRRTMHLVIPVQDPSVWNDAKLRTALVETLGFLSDDTWEFTFTQAPVPSDVQLHFTSADDVPELYSNPDSVVLLSGGADSLCAAIDAVSSKSRHPILVSHTSAPNSNAEQKNLSAELRRALQWEFPHIRVWAHRKGSDPADTSQRTRSFLFACLAWTVAANLKLPSVLLADNGIVSLNLATNKQLYGAQVSRSTHPKFIFRFNQLAKLLLPAPPIVSNPLWNLTRPEVLKLATDSGHADLLSMTVSCAHRRNLPTGKTHCGVCSQCIDRRFGFLAAGLEDLDPAAKYAVDIFQDEIKEGNPRTMAVSYVRWAANVSQCPDDELFTRNEELFEAVEDSDQPTVEAAAYTSMVKRHGDSIRRVAADQIAKSAPRFLDGTLTEHSLVALLASGAAGIDPRLQVVEFLCDLLEGSLPAVFQSRKPANEREVQEAVEALLKAADERMHREQPTLAFAGIGTKPDFSKPLNNRGWLFIELKFPRTKERLREITTEISSRVQIYRAQGAFPLFVVYDPERFIVNDEEFVDSFSKLPDVSDEQSCWFRVVR